LSVKLRLRRMGRRNRPYYRIVAIDSRSARDGRYLDSLGTYDPLINPARIDLIEDRAIYWLNNGAIPSDTVKSFLRKKGVLFKLHLMKQGADSAVIEEEFKKWQLQQLEKAKQQEALKEQKKRESKKKKAAQAKAAPEGEGKGEAVASQPSASEAAQETAAEPTTEGDGQKS